MSFSDGNLTKAVHLRPSICTPFVFCACARARWWGATSRHLPTLAIIPALLTDRLIYLHVTCDTLFCKSTCHFTNRHLKMQEKIIDWRVLRQKVSTNMLIYNKIYAWVAIAVFTKVNISESLRNIEKVSEWFEDCFINCIILFEIFIPWKRLLYEPKLPKMVLLVKTAGKNNRCNRTMERQNLRNVSFRNNNPPWKRLIYVTLRRF